MEIKFYDRNIQGYSFVSFCVYSFALVSRPYWYLGIYILHFVLMLVLSIYFLIKKNKPLSNVYSRATMILLFLGIVGLIFTLVVTAFLSGVPIN